MKKIFRVGGVAVLLLAACDKPEPIESVESLAGNPERLRELRLQCKADRTKVGEAQCNAVNEATQRRFLGDGTPYTPTAPGPEGITPSAPRVPSERGVAKD